MTESTNPEFELARDFALCTRKHCFITGKAGTGKTTLLKQIVEQTKKNVVVAAPTGVAAINAGGVTLHSLFGLPLTCFTPSSDYVDLNVATNRPTLHHHMHYRKDKLQLLREMDLLIIDEISMTRCDILDAIDYILRSIRRNERPFGNTQVLFFGDMRQLPPVVKEPEWSILKSYYKSPYFFDSQAWQQLDAAEIELQTVYRQSDDRFLTLLNHVRDRKMDEEDFELLKTRFNPQFKTTEKGYVLLSTHNYKVDAINTDELAKLPGNIHSFEALIEGEFPNNLFPCEQVLQVKPGAQVMFIRNDSEEGKYYNGKLATIKKIAGDIITVSFNSNGEDYTLRRETWENIDYSIEDETGRILKTELGTFSQFPLRLAWAVTIHKSQGLTFDKVIIDAGRSFAAGQVYVALSRCRSLEGIVLRSLIPPSALYSDDRIGEFSSTHHSINDLQNSFTREKHQYYIYLLLKLFTFSGLFPHLEEWKIFLEKKEIDAKEAALALHAQTMARAGNIRDTAEKFQRQLQSIIDSMDADPNQITFLKERCEKAIKYFTDQIAEQLIAPLRSHINELAYKKKMKRYLAIVQSIEADSWRKIEQLYNGTFSEEKLFQGERVHSKDKIIKVVSTQTSVKKKEKGNSFKDTLDLHRQGKSPDEIAATRGLTVGTIKEHLAKCVAEGEIDIKEILPDELIKNVTAYMNENNGASLTQIRRALDDKYDFTDIRIARAHYYRTKT